MLQELIIKNFAIIETLELSFKKGMTVLTGETGAGKSIIIDAVGLLAGGRGSSEFVRFGEKKCSLEGIFSSEKNDELKKILLQESIEYDESVIMIQREIYANGRNVCRVNGSIVTISTLRKIGESLIDIHSQHEHQELMHVEKHLKLLDQFGSHALVRLKKEYQSYYNEYHSLNKQLNEWQYNEQEAAQRIDMLSFQLEEIEAASLVNDNEEEELKEERTRLANYQKIMESLSSSYDAIQGNETNGLDAIGQAMQSLQSIEEMNVEYKRIAELVSTSFYQLQEAASDLYHALDSLAYDEERLNEIEERLEVVHQLKRKYGNSIIEINSYAREAQLELEKLRNREEGMDDLSKKLALATKKVIESGKELSSERRKIAKRLKKSIQEQLKELYMEKVVFEVKFKQDVNELNEKNATIKGLDFVEFYVSTNPGEPLKPLNKTASGGELSRMILALKTIFSKSQGVTSIIFDEVDTGVSGRVAQAIANKIYSVASHSQVLCITHLPQVAAMADQHLLIEKEESKNRTITHVNELIEKEAIEEIARMLAGTKITKLTMETARELKNEAKRIK
ncbi:DNA repair protein RecN [Lacticigenium naphthae]|uniref:DNA repair protein RecN n=1 Tax=Lacticigenium naphthae TaxID=515351 RepID=UPI00041A2488|nr:DNA repair protein RecN [Lacticigenium naphthae]